MAEPDYKSKANRFVNPYNFIQFPGKKAVAYKAGDRHTGVIEYTVITETPLFIPNSSSETAFKVSDDCKDHKSYDFFSYTELDGNKRYDGEFHMQIPVIPGSEMRGVVRNVYETLTDSCMGLLNNEKHPVKRSPARFEHGLIYRDQDRVYHLYKARSQSEGTSTDPRLVYPPKGYEKKHNGDKVNGGYLLKWGMGGAGKKKKKHYHILFKEEEIKGVQLSKDIISNRLSEVLNSYLEQPTLKKQPLNKTAYEEYRDDLERFLKNNEEGYFPVTYSRLHSDDQNVYLAPANYSKEVSQYSLEMLAGEFAPCKKNFCPACDLFGYVGETDGQGKGSRIRFSDLYPEKKEAPKDYYYKKDTIVLEALGEPKLGNTDFYLEKPQSNNTTFWTYDYYVSRGRLQAGMGKIRGRKYYWHHRHVNMSKNVKPDRFNKTIRPVRKGVSFTGKLYFEEISETQLQQLIWILNSGTEKLGLKLGGAKPLGYGSISCKVDSVRERRLFVENGNVIYSVEEKKPETITYEKVGFSSSVKAEFYKIAGLESIPEDIEITYPKDFTQKNKAIIKGYQWFVNNHFNPKAKFPKKREEAMIHTPLPKILDEDITMAYCKPEEPRNNKKSFKKY